jgi:hypothetical protein
VSLLSGGRRRSSIVGMSGLTCNHMYMGMCMGMGMHMFKKGLSKGV